MEESGILQGNNYLFPHTDRVGSVSGKTYHTGGVSQEAIGQKNGLLGHPYNSKYIPSLF